MRPLLWVSKNLKKLASALADMGHSVSPNTVRKLLASELGTNVAKYGALSNDEGYIEIARTLASPPQGGEFRLRWRERGMGLSFRLPAIPGLAPD